MDDDHREVELGTALTGQSFFSGVIICKELALAHLLPLPQMEICGFQGSVESLYFRVASAPDCHI